jgi:hypothetical protein
MQGQRIALCEGFLGFQDRPGCDCRQDPLIGNDQFPLLDGLAKQIRGSVHLAQRDMDSGDGIGVQIALPALKPCISASTRRASAVRPPRA